MVSEVDLCLARRQLVRIDEWREIVRLVQEGSPVAEIAERIGTPAARVLVHERRGRGL